MSPVRVVWSRTLGAARNSYSTAVAVGGFLAGAAALLAWNLSLADGGRLAMPSLWAASAGPLLPLLAALAGMDVWSDERRTGRIDLLLSSPVPDGDFVLGKFLGVWTVTVAVTVLSLVFPLATLAYMAPSALKGTGILDFLPALFILSVQGALWSAVAVTCSAFFRHGAASAVAAIALTSALPRGLWAGLAEWSSVGRAAFGEFPFDAHAVDVASGLLPVAATAAYAVFTAACLFVNARAVSFLRFPGRGSRASRCAVVGVSVMAVVAALAAAYVGRRAETTVELPLGMQSAALSQRTRSILAESSGDVRVTAFISRSDARFREVGRLLRSLKRDAASLGGARFELSWVDPRWDVGAAERLVRRGVATGSVLFEKGHRSVALPLADGVGERLCASTVRRLSVTQRRLEVRWTTGHGEGSPEEYGASGMSDIARELAREGFRNSPIDLSSDSPLGGSCALIVVAGAKDDFSRVELDRLEAYLKEGGRLLVLMNGAASGGVTSLLSSWGIRPAETAVPGSATLSGTDVIVSDFSEHAVAAPFAGSRVILEKPVAFTASGAAETVKGADRLDFSPIASVGSVAYAVAVERGADVGADLALRPTRIIAIGDATFVLNGPLASRASANRDFFLGCVSYLAGLEATGATGSDSGIFEFALDRRSRARFVLVTAAAAPAAVFLIMMVVAWRRRHRS